MEKLDLQTKDLSQENIDKLVKIFPDILTEVEKDGKLIKTINVDKLKELIGDFATNDEEIYELTWAGKQKSKQKLLNPINKTLRPVKEDSVDFENTENLYIEGDNYEVLKLLQESYLNKIKMIYIDPPYNTGKDFVYKDNYSMSKEDYEEEAGIVDEEGNKLFKNTTTNGRFHSDWLSMMYERLMIARDLLKDDGVIFISIDDNEVHNLRKICDEIFFEENVEQYVWNLADFTESSFTKTASNTVRFEHEYIIACYKNLKKLGRYKEFRFKNRDDFSNIDNDPRGDWMSGNLSRNGITSTTGSKYFTIKTPKGIEYTRNWTVSKEEFKELIKDNRIYFSRDGEGVPRLKIFKNEPSFSIQSSIFSGVKTSISGKNQIKDLFENKILFDFPKPINLIQRLSEITTKESDIILDFFSGSATTAHAVMQLNTEDNGNRKFIMVQLPEPTDENSEAYKAGYKTIAEIGKERIRRASKKIQEENKDKDLSNIDFGFKVFKLDSSNMKDVYYNPKAITQKTLTQLESNIKEDRTDEDFLYQVLLDLAIPISAKVKEEQIQNKKVFKVDDNFLIACFEDNVTLDLVKELSKENPLRLVFKDSSFKNDTEKINIEEYLKHNLPNAIIKVI